MALQEEMDHQVHQVPRANLVVWPSKEREDYQGTQVQQDFQEKGACQGHQDLAHLGIQAQKVCREFQGVQEPPELQVLKVMFARQSLNLVHLVLQGLQVNLGH